MATIVIATEIAAPIETCFDLARDVDAHVATSLATRERAVAGRMSGLLELGDSVTFEAVHFGVRQRLTSRITELQRPERFVDEMIDGAFASFHHLHEFAPIDGGVLMRDTLTWRAPLGFLGMLADRVFLERHMRRYMMQKQAALKAMAERAARSAR